MCEIDGKWTTHAIRITVAVFERLSDGEVPWPYGPTVPPDLDTVDLPAVVHPPDPAIGFATMAESVHWLLLYDLAADYLERRPPHREQHLLLANEARARGELVMAGALVDPVDAATLVFRGPDETVAIRFAEADPYVVNGLVTRWRVRRWQVVVGPDPEAP